MGSSVSTIRRGSAAYLRTRYYVLFQELPSVMLPIETNSVFPYSPKPDVTATGEGTGMPSKHVLQLGTDP